MRRWIGATVVVAVMLWAGGASASPVSLSFITSANALSFGGPPVTASIGFTTGATAQTASLGLVPSDWRDAAVFGSPLRTSDETISGAGRKTGGFASSCCDRPAGDSVCNRGGPPDEGGGIDLALPADSTTIVSYRVALAAAPWPAPVTLGAVVTVPAQANDSADLTRYQLAPKRFTITGPRGVDIRLRAGRGAQRHPHGRYPTVTGGAVTITGTTAPKVAGARLTVGFRSTTTRQHGTIGSVVTSAAGAFTIVWLPTLAGTFTITAVYPHPAAGLLPDRSCDLALTIGPRKAPRTVAGGVPTN